MPHSRARVGAVVATALFLTACGGTKHPRPAPPTSPAATISASPTAASLTWAACPGAIQVSSSARCTTLDVPLDRSGAVAGSVSLQLVRREATDPQQRIGSLLINPGGPGGSTVDEFDFLYGELSDGLKAHFDVVGWDPRGVGHSDPVRCVDNSELDRLLAQSPDTTTSAGVATVVRDTQTYVRGCEQRSGTILPFIGTVDTAKDLDAIRTALGEAKVTYLGYSYGTEIGYEYASLFPDRVRALVLDGAVDPTLSLIEHGVSQNIGFQKSLDAFLADCAASRSCLWKFHGDAHAAYRALVAQARQSPIPVQDSRRVLTLALFESGVAAALYSRDTWKDLQQGLQMASQGDGSVMLEMADALSGRHSNGSYDNLEDAFTAITCIDSPVPDGTQVWIDEGNRARAQAPDFADGSLASTGPGYACSLFAHRPTKSVLPTTVTGAPPALIVGSTGDPATPFAEAQGLARAFSGSVLLTRTGQGHTGYSASACVRQHADAYLISLVIPAAGTVCKE